MARILTQVDVYNVMNAMVEDLTGQTNSIRVRDTSSFISAGETVLSYPTENVLNSLGLLMGRILIAARPYKGKWDLINAMDTGLYTHRMEKISFYSRPAIASGAFNTKNPADGSDLYTNLAPGFTNGQNIDATSGNPQSTKSMWEQFPGIPLLMNFGGSSTITEATTIYEVQLQQAFRSEGEFNEFISGILLEKENDIELIKEAFRNAIVLNHIAGVYDLSSDMPGSVVNLTEAFNDKYGTSYTSEELRSTYLKEFLAFMVARIKQDFKNFSHKSSMYHWTPAKVVDGVSYPLLRHTPREKCKLFMYQPLFTDAESMVLPEIFNDRYLDIGNFEGVDWWQNEHAPASISVTPAIPATSGANIGTQVKGNAVNLEYVVGCLFDSDAMMVDVQMDRAVSSPLEARKLYRTLYWHMLRNGINDFTEKSIIYIMADPTT